MKPNHSLSGLLLIAALTACQAPTGFTYYSGQQQNWPLSTGALVQTNNGVPIFLGPPSQPYTVLGVITGVNANNYTIARRCKAEQGDAVIYLNSRESNDGISSYHWGTMYGGYNFSQVERTTTSIYAVIRWADNTNQTTATATTTEAKPSVRRGPR